MKYIYIFLLLSLQILIFAQSRYEPAFINNNNFFGQKQYKEIKNNALLNTSDEIKSLVDSSCYFDWDTAKGEWIKDYRMIYGYDKYGEEITKKSDYIGNFGTTIYPYSFENKTYYPDGSLKNQLSSLWSYTQLIYLGVTDEHFEYDHFGNIIDVQISYRNEATGEWHVGWRGHRNFDSDNNLISINEYDDDSLEKLYLSNKELFIYNYDHKPLEYSDSLYDPGSGKFWCKIMKYYKYDKYGRETEFVAFWNYSSAELHEIYQKTETQYDSLGYIITHTYFNYDGKGEKWIPRNKIRDIMNSDMQPVQEFYDTWNESEQMWEHSYWNIKTYNENPDFCQSLTKTWNVNEQAYIDDQLEENIYLSNQKLSEHNFFVWRNGWKADGILKNDYDTDGHLIRTTSIHYKPADTTIEYASKLENYYYSADIQPLTPDSSFDLKVYPNPATNLLIVQKAPAGTMLQIFNSKGSVLSEMHVTDPTSLIDISAFTEGAYIIKAKYQEYHRSSIFIKVAKPD